MWTCHHFPNLSLLLDTLIASRIWLLWIADDECPRAQPFYAVLITLWGCIFTSRIANPITQISTGLGNYWTVLPRKRYMLYQPFLFKFMKVFFNILCKTKCDDFENLSWFDKKKLTFCCFYFLWFLMRWKKRWFLFWQTDYLYDLQICI